MVFLGLEVNTILMTLKIPDEKFEEIKVELEKWCYGRMAEKREVQRLVRLLNFAAGCIKPGRIYFSRILNFLREMGTRSVVTQEVIQDIDWWKECAQEHNGISLIMNPKWEQPDSIFSLDSCLTGCGAWFQGEYFHHVFSEGQKYTFTDINLLECATILVAVRTWGGS